MSSSVNPAFRSAAGIASTGASPMISGDRAVTAVDTIRASGVRPRSLALTSLITTRAAAPSLSAQAFPAVTVPSGRNTGCSWLTLSMVTPGRGPSSRETTVPSGRVAGVISRAQKPEAICASARFWLRTAKASCSSRDIPSSCCTFSAVCPMAMYASGSSPSSRGSRHRGAPAPLRASVRDWALRNIGFFRS